MSIPNGIVKIKKDGVEFTSNVDRVNYTLRELTRAALRDVGRFICNRARKQIKRRTGRVAKIHSIGSVRKMATCRLDSSRADFTAVSRSWGRRSSQK